MKKSKKTLLMLAAAVCCAALLTSCGDKKSEPAAATTEKEAFLTVEEIRDALFKAAGPAKDMTTLTPDTEDYAENFEYLFDIGPDIAEDSSVSYCTDGSLADEIDVFILKDQKDVEKLKSLLSSRAASRSAKYRGYYDKESEKAAKALILSKDRYIIFVISDNNSAAKQAFESLFK